MLNTLVLVALAGLGTASPTVQPINFAAILSATGVSLSGPPATATGQTGVYNAAAASSIASAAATAVASASATQSVAARDLEKRTFCFFGIGWCGNSGGSGYGSGGWGVPTTSAPKAAASTSCATSSAKAVIVTPTKSVPAVTSIPVTTPAPAVTSAPSTCTPISWTNTNAFTTASACSAPYEVGTYCGFINPEDPCAVQPDGYGAQVSQPDTPAAFLAYQPFHDLAKNAQAPSGYEATFTDLNAAVTANSYMGLYTLKSYDVAQCAALCDKTDLCTGINIYIERDPSINPEGCSCTNPSSISNYKCTLWGSGVDKAAATNTGQGRSGFEVVVTASNGYEKTNNTQPATPSGWTNPQSCGGNVHNHPSTCIGQQFFPGPFDAGVCASYAAAQNAKNSFSVGLMSWASFFGYSPLKCNFFNAFMVKENGVAKGTYCSLFSQQYAPSAASYQPAVSGGVSWGIESSWSFCHA
ncbi:hypothetical protein CkaCkLH20_10163 [Colletotrichum karsti]|uniref:Uncharacterized protein n=1 Tax=Colletotrichum karsti TaxID=1095194 RepID=A0A9P6I003_9PEZI|nr:uncharacterized protein CkaCkLH20_10163 [Colletotrichum karsti]KAF9872336.1 hypothetical protein CkaCkLH20_10163 [Colletotrichum karsti]